MAHDHLPVAPHPLGRLSAQRCLAAHLLDRYEETDDAAAVAESPAMAPRDNNP